MKINRNSNTNNFLLSITWKFCCLALIILSLPAFTNDDLTHVLAVRAQQKLTALHGAELDRLKIKKCEITISDEGFLRYRRTYLSGKQEYYSFNLSRLRDIGFMGNTHSGSLVIQTMEDDIIVQTYNDRSGNVDSMSVNMKIDMQAVEAEDLISLNYDLFELKRLSSRN